MCIKKKTFYETTKKFIYNFFSPFWYIRRMFQWRFRYSRLLFRFILLQAGYKKSTLFDLGYFKLLVNGFIKKNISVMKIFFKLRSRFNSGKLISRSNMRYYFFLRLFQLPVL